MPECTCGYSYKLYGEAHCSKHHYTYALLNGAFCPECKRERNQKEQQYQGDLGSDVETHNRAW